MSYTRPHIICSLPCVFAIISPISAVSVVSHICDLLILHSFALPLFSRVHPFDPYLFCSFPCQVNAMGTPYETTGARCRTIGPSCRPKEPDVVTRAGDQEAPSGLFRPCPFQTRGPLVGKGVPWQAKRPLMGPLLGRRAPCHTTGGPLTGHKAWPIRQGDLPSAT